MLDATAPEPPPTRCSLGSLWASVVSLWFLRAVLSGHRCAARIMALAEQVRNASKVIKHSQYNHPSLINNDIALIKLERPVLLNSHVNTICLPQRGVDVAINSNVTFQESVSNDSIFPRSFLKGFPEGIWWSFVTMSTVGYISTGLAVASLGNNIKLYGSKVVIILALRISDRSFEGGGESGEKDLFDDPALYIHQLIYYRSSFGMVLSDYLVKKTFFDDKPCEELYKDTSKYYFVCSRGEECGSPEQLKRQTQRSSLISRTDDSGRYGIWDSVMTWSCLEKGRGGFAPNGW
ncbi:hypothetical protein OS493_014329 [Desmophyllum pertusum]|uniref:Peptidase S1 domain-containing protein n=1 Tax=Desmophyllum pertusum TaxID=174260 RepID=A0A9X0CRV9_9CNID|nr:hypothetical protein OS493_014329 [Desmophyllum pertusum]